MMFLLWYLAFLSPIFACVGVIFLYRQHCLARPKHTIPVFVYALMILFCAGIGYLFGMIAGNDIVCAPSRSPGNLCSLAGVFGIGPLASAGAIVLMGLLVLLLPPDK
jgi:hypothetical protein